MLTTHAALFLLFVYKHLHFHMIVFDVDVNQPQVAVECVSTVKAYHSDRFLCVSVQS